MLFRSPGDSSPGRVGAFTFAFVRAAADPLGGETEMAASSGLPIVEGTVTLAPASAGASSARRRASALPSPASFLPSHRAQSVGARSLRAKRPRRPALNFGGEGSPPPTPSPAFLSLSSLPFWSPGLGHPVLFGIWKRRRGGFRRAGGVRSLASLPVSCGALALSVLVCEMGLVVGPG